MTQSGDGSHRQKLEHLLQHDVRTIIEGLGSGRWLPLYVSRRDDQESFGIFSALLPEVEVASALARPEWDLTVGDGTPGFVGTGGGGRTETTTYFRFGIDDPIEPIVIHREFGGVLEDYLELSEEFRLLFNLYERRDEGEFIRLSSRGDEEVVCRMGDGDVRVLRSLMESYLAARQLHLAVYFDVLRFSDIPLEEVPEELRSWRDERPDRRIDFSVHKSEGMLAGDRRTTVSRLLGKVLLRPRPRESSGVWPFNDQPKEYAEFLIAGKGSGEPALHTCNPGHLSDYFGGNPGRPHYLTPVFFRKQVLNKYFAEPSKYEVRDGYLACGYLWGLRMDNNHADYIVVYLGDLGQDLDHAEQLYWRSFNVPPDGGTSEVNYRRSILAEFTDPANVDLLFKQRFETFRKAWRERWGWDVILPLTEADAHLYRTLRIPLAEDQSEFDGQVLALAKILIDSLNEPELARRCKSLPEGAKGITKLQAFVADRAAPAVDQVIPFLRGLQELRSTSTAHRKGTGDSSAYAKAMAKLDLDPRRLRVAGEELLTRATAVLAALDSVQPDTTAG